MAQITERTVHRIRSSGTNTVTSTDRRVTIHPELFAPFMTPAPKTEDELLERAAALEDSEIASLLRDLNRGGVMVLAAPPLPEEVQELIELIGKDRVPIQNASEEEVDNLRPKAARTEGDLVSHVASKFPLVIEDPMFALEGGGGDTISARKLKDASLILPAHPEAHVFNNGLVRRAAIGFNDSGTQMVLRINGEVAGAFSTVDGKRAVSDTIEVLNKARSSEISMGSRVCIPDTRSGITTLVTEIAFFKSLREQRVGRNYHRPQGSAQEAILSVLLTHSDKDVEVATQKRREMENSIRQFTDKDKPVPISIAFALGLIAPNPLKIRECADNLPHYGWLQFVDFMATMNEKVKTFYRPGLDVVVFEEGSLFAPILGIGPETVRRNVETTRMLVDKLEAPMRIIPLETTDFPADKVARAVPPKLHDSQIFAITCSQPDMLNPEFLDCLYAENARKQRDQIDPVTGKSGYARLIPMIGEEMWNRSRAIAEAIARHMQYRKDSKLFDKLVGHPIAIDATVTDKSDRISLQVTPVAMINHAMMVVRRAQGGSGLHKVLPEPEYRIARTHPTARPVKIDRSELGLGAGKMTFYYDETPTSEMGQL